jgi:hypothetical protein
MPKLESMFAHKSMRLAHFREDGSLTISASRSKLNIMRRLMFTLLLLPGVTRGAQAQKIPGRELFEFPLGSVSEGGALSTLTGDGFRNPAAIYLAPALLARVGVSSLMTGTDQSVSAQMVHVAASVYGTTIGFSLARAAVTGIARTDIDPESLGDEIPYSGTVISLSGARRETRHLVTGAALRYLTGQLDDEGRSALGLDAGAILEHLSVADLRVGLSSFLWRPGARSGDGVALTASADARIAGRDSTKEFRFAYAYSDAPGYAVDHYLSTSGRYAMFEARAGVARTTAFSHVASRVRLAVVMHYAHYVVAVSREDAPSGFAPSYQFSLSTTLPRSR